MSVPAAAWPKKQAEIEIRGEGIPERCCLFDEEKLLADASEGELAAQNHKLPKVSGGGRLVFCGML